MLWQSFNNFLINDDGGLTKLIWCCNEGLTIHLLIMATFDETNLTLQQSFGNSFVAMVAI